MKYGKKEYKDEENSYLQSYEQRVFVPTGNRDKDFSADDDLDTNDEMGFIRRDKDGKAPKQKKKTGTKAKRNSTPPRYLNPCT